ncbi:MAG: GntR family transcriptional regulator [Xanthobacteraceae bacterium]|nr:GntR family transcriptional regulator [Xanthobacteraceae bacterium]
MPFQAVASQRLYEQVAEQVTALIARGEFKPGDRLPPERDLAKAPGREPADRARGHDRA